MNLKPDYQTVSMLFREKLFVIPDYQRSYSWGKKQRSDLFNDIRKIAAYTDNRHHYMSSVVCLLRDPLVETETDRYVRLEVVDGQQRITSIIIILKVLSEKLKKSDNENERKTGNDISDMLVKNNGNIILLQANHDNSNIFREYIITAKKPDKSMINTKADKNFYDAFIETEQFVKDWEGSLIDLYKIVFYRLGFVYFVIEDEGTVYSTFEVLNSRGLSVDWLDKTKSVIMGIIYDKVADKTEASDLFRKSNMIWKDIYDIIGIDDVSGDEILRFSATMKSDGNTSRMLSAEESLEYFREYCALHQDQILDMQYFINSIAKKLKNLYDNIKMNAVTGIIHARLLYIAIDSSDSIGSGDKNELLSQWERMTFRIFGIYKKDSRTSVGDYIRLAREIFNGTLKGFSDIKSRMDEIGEGYPIEEGWQTLLKERNCYDKWENELRYFFSKYEEYISRKMGILLNQKVWASIWEEDPASSIEHIFPQNPDSSWIGKMGKGNGVVIKNMHRLGNLALLPPSLNSKAQNKCFSDKKKIYKQANLLHLAEIISKNEWTLDSINQREKALFDFAVEEWG